MAPWLIGIGLLLTPAARASPASPSVTDTLATPATWQDRFHLTGYGTLRYDRYDWQTDPERRDAIDTERLTVYPSWQLTPTIQFLAEIEFEHGGTGGTLEFDRFEEFGEFEYEVEKGGEVVLEQMNVRFTLHPRFDLAAGRVKLPIGLAAVNDEPTEYYTVGQGEGESQVIPVNWYENGLQARWRIGADDRVRLTASLVNGLDSSGFSSASWVVRGQQLRFETANAEDLAITARIDAELGRGFNVGSSGYYGDSADNRPKPDLDVDAHVGIVEGHAWWEQGPLRVTALGLYGTLENADAVSRANRNLSNNLNAKRTPVGSAAYATYVELGCGLHQWLGMARPLLVFGRWDRYDTMAEVTGDTFDNPRWDRETWTFGLNQRPANQVVLKAQVAVRTLGLIHDAREETVSLGMGVEF